MSQAAHQPLPPKLSLSVQYASDARPLPTRQQLRRWIKIALQRDIYMTLRIVDEAEGRELNKNYRGKDYATNVLTFVYDDVPIPSALPALGACRTYGDRSENPSGRGQISPVLQVNSHSIDQKSGEIWTGQTGLQPIHHKSDRLLGEVPMLSGDVVICAPVVEREAREQGKDLLAHYAHMTIHALLHLQGYDHENDADAAAMEALETRLMLKLRHTDPYQTNPHQT